jgi:hypothetical protein
MHVQGEKEVNGRVMFLDALHKQLQRAEEVSKRKGV